MDPGAYPAILCTFGGAIGDCGTGYSPLFSQWGLLDQRHKRGLNDGFGQVMVPGSAAV